VVEEFLGDVRPDFWVSDQLGNNQGALLATYEMFCKQEATA
jgi:hypothetical protein